MAALVKDLLTPLIAAIVGQPDFSGRSSSPSMGASSSSEISSTPSWRLCVVAAAIYFVVMPMNMIVERRRRGEALPDPTTKNCSECLSEVLIAALRCFLRAALQT